MKALIQRVNTHPNYAKIMMWGRLIAITGSAQVIVQLLGLVSGILIIRLLPTKEYALYTLANTMLGTMTILSDGGISSGVMGQGGKVWENKEKLGAVLATGLKLRKTFALGSLIVSLPILIYLLLYQGASVLMTILIVLSIIPAFYAALSDSVLEIVPKLHQQIKPLQTNQISVSIMRLLFSGATIFFFPFTYIAILASGLPRVLGNIQLRKVAYTKADKNQKSDPKEKKAILKVVKYILPTAIYYSLSGQITIWLVSFFGNSSSVAQVGALSRLAIVLGLLSIIVNTLFIPRFARLKENKKVLAQYLIKIQIIIISISALVLLAVYIFSYSMLWLLGNAYLNLKYELLISILSSCIALMSGITFSLYLSRGWAMNPIISISINIATVICSVFIYDVSTLQGVLWVSVFTAFIQYIMNLFFIIFKIRKIVD